MTTITALCSSCSGTARLTGAEVGVRTDTSGSAQLSFLCLRCEVVSTAALTADQCAQLEAAGVGVERAARPHPEHPHAGPALTRDDLLDLHLLLATDGWFAALEQLAPTRVA